MLATALLLLCSCGRQPDARSVSATPPLDPAALRGERALAATARCVAIGPRVSGTPGAKAMARFIESELVSLGIDTSVDAFWDRAPGGSNLFRNVIGFLPGRNASVIVLASHYDTKKGISDTFVGANDSGSSTGLLLELASVLRGAALPGPGILLAFLDGEECAEHYSPWDGLHGSRRLANQLRANRSQQPVRAVIVLDMIGDRDLSITIPPDSSPELMRLVLRAAREEGVREAFSISRYAILDDHVPFLAAGMPAIDLIDFQYGSRPGANDYWHTDSDTMDKLSAESLETVGHVVIRTLNAISTESP